MAEPDYRTITNALLALCEQALEACATAGPHSSAMALADDIETMVRRGVDEARRNG